ncbi:MAG: hypothetical protein PHX50_11255 [Massilibacteroides sp.]|nr:hypothetical protein [Massilibacteroides sp.]MDD4661640.1 hypothetical protein [Massilibacteroides sp.]
MFVHSSVCFFTLCPIGIGLVAAWFVREKSGVDGEGHLCSYDQDMFTFRVTMQCDFFVSNSVDFVLGKKFIPDEAVFYETCTVIK